MSTLSSANVTDVNLVLKERTHMRLCLNMLIFTHNLGNWLIDELVAPVTQHTLSVDHTHIYAHLFVSVYADLPSVVG